MRIAIVSNGRCGSTSLLYLINCAFHNIGIKYDVYSEPFNFNVAQKTFKYKNIDFLTEKKNILLKTFINDDNYPYESFETASDYWNWFTNFFEKIIILERKDKRLQAESLYYHLKLNTKYFNIGWHKQKIYEFENDDYAKIDNLMNWLDDCKNKYEYFTNKEFPKFYFEDIFVEKKKEEWYRLENYLNINLSEECINEWIHSPDKIVRLNKKNKLF